MFRSSFIIALLTVAAFARSGSAWADSCGPSGHEACPPGTWGVADPIASAVKAATAPNANGTKPDGAKAGNSVAGEAANVANKMTGNAADSQSDVFTNSQNLNNVSSGGSRVAGTLDTLEGLLLLPFHPWDAGKFLFSGQQAQKAGDQLEVNSKTLGASSAGMSGSLDAVSGSGSSGSGASTQNASGASHAGPSAADAANASSPAYNSARAQDLFQQLETSYGINRDEFVSAAIQTKGNPGAIGEFMQEKTGNAKLGREAAVAALDSYVASAGEGGTYVAAAVPERNPASASPSSATGGSTTSGALSLPSVELEAKVAKKAEEEKSLRDRLKKAMAERQSAGSAPGSLADSAESLQPLREGLFQQAADASDDGQSLFDVVHTKYVGLTNRMRPKTAVFSH
jgi:hypothetical protein